MLLIILILLVIILFFSLKKKESFRNNKPRIAVYSYNFGNFRKELNKNIDNFEKINQFDYYLYTDKNVKSKKWKIIKVPLQQRTEHMNANRVTAKYYKWKHIPRELKKYDYILHIDCARIKYLNNLSYNDILNIIDKNKNKSYIGRKHPFLKNIYDECNKVKKVKVDRSNYVDLWEKKLLNEKVKIKANHIETCIFIRKINDNILSKKFEEIYEEIMKNKLCRDQLVFYYIIDKYNLYDKITDTYEFNKL